MGKHIIYSDRDNIEFRQLMIVITNLIWLCLASFYFDTDAPIKFAIIRCIFFFFMGICRFEMSFEKDTTDLNDLNDSFTSSMYWKGVTTWFCDFWSWVLLVWIFGISIFDPSRLF